MEILMELHRRRPHLFWIAFILVGGILGIWASQNGWGLRILIVPLGSGALLVVSLIMVLGALAGLASTLRPAPIVLDETGLRLRAEGINQLVPWASIDALILEPRHGASDNSSGPRLLLVPSADADLGTVAEYQNKVDGRPSIILLPIDSLRASQDQVVQALATYAGQRFINGASDSAVETESSASAT
ncbi:hypothetical protein ACIBF5_00555 [Micromonospora sp. NPDC050417]|uniref:hypothetical protein n=1 Tax=Micromonospora sp. NPDC050417 TaxID=3364280 RepID=UPI0037B6F715